VADLLVAPEDEVPAALRVQVLALHDEAWPPVDGDPASLPGHDPALRPLSMLLVDGGRVVAALDILSKEIDHRGHRYRASGLSTVVTAPNARRHGHGRRLVGAARERIAADGADLCLFTCDDALAPFYEAAGFEALLGTQLIGGTRDEPLPSGPLGKVTLAAFFTPLAIAHRADFLAADVELYPGGRDRLW
jgi:GNAT superfamily N-acetyltransferase